MEAASPLVGWLVLFGAFLVGVETTEKLLDSVLTEKGESSNSGDRASSWRGKQISAAWLILIWPCAISWSWSVIQLERFFFLLSLTAQCVPFKGSIDMKWNIYVC